MKKILLACEESQAVCIEFRNLGFEAYSNDIMDCSGGHPEWHLKMDVFEAIKLMDWDCMIAFPPCTHLAVSGARYFEQKRKDGRQQQGIDFFMNLVNSNIDKIAIENPIGIMSRIYRKPDQIIQPCWFGDTAYKSTCLWLKNLPKLIPTNMVEPEFTTYKHSGKKVSKHHYDTFLLPKNQRGLIRSKTFIGIAKAMAEQWCKII